ncbi:MAG: GNAT family N-acetyltransferase [Rhodothermales bacterium]|nr:GNAT family N-acetyltransferase [Rhodothermales bacterium]MBO6779839.1 GNAT family N-acetyltransferase [Rhodothermales bacterium]
MIQEIEIRHGLDGLTPGRIITLYRRAPLLRAVDTAERVWQKFESSSLVITAWHGEQLAGIARALSDGIATSYLCELAVEPDVQGVGVGKALLDKVFEACKGTELVLRHSSISSKYYERIGFTRVNNAWSRRC